MVRLGCLTWNSRRFTVYSDTPDSMETTRFFTKVRSFVGRYFGTRDRLVIFGPGMEMGFVKFFMWNCEDIGLKTEVEMPIQGSREMQVNLLSICYNAIKYELQSLYHAPKAVRDQEHRSLLTPEGRLIANESLVVYGGGVGRPRNLIFAFQRISRYWKVISKVRQLLI